MALQSALAGFCLIWLSMAAYVVIALDGWPSDHSHQNRSFLAAHEGESQNGGEG